MNDSSQTVESTSPNSRVQVLTRTRPSLDVIIRSTIFLRCDNSHVAQQKLKYSNETVDDTLLL
jgi:hypothetical protein